MNSNMMNYYSYLSQINHAFFMRQMSNFMAMQIVLKKMNANKSNKKEKEENNEISTNNQTDEDNSNNADQFQANEEISDVIKENINQIQQFENYQPQDNLTVDEIDPDFMYSFISDQTLFDGNGHNLIGKWAQGEKRGGYDYIPPNGWIGFGLKVLGKYDNGNNDWLACNGRAGEWPIAYHGACIRNSSDEIKQIVKTIIEENLKPGAGQGYRNSDDVKHPGNKVGVGVYCSPQPSTMEGYAGTLEVNGHKYKVAFMLRVKPDKIRYSDPNIWVLNGGNGDFSEIRPYRFLIKKIS
jgi:hypothetical protein